MRISISIGSAYYNGEEWDSLVDYTMAADRIGVDEAWSAEAWGMEGEEPTGVEHDPTKHNGASLESE